jgi:uncharacterized protein YyaL (SSP411 family)
MIVMPNRLIHETSPYLLQHADNPVDWYPWTEDVLQLARKENKPIFLSIGYSACHWCHVMAHESFQDPETADYLNRHFISIKVDREERPDLDSIYMDAVVAMTGQGGWPMSLFLTPDSKPFYGGTYFPPDRRFGMPSFKEVLAAVVRAWETDPDDIQKAAAEITSHISKPIESSAATAPLQLEMLSAAVQKLSAVYDWQNGGWGTAPKFPSPMTIDFLFTQSTRGNEQATQIAVHALEAMDRGGIYDRIGGGFHRYSTDEHWLVPHFEKMLYDNAQLALAFLHGYLITREPTLRSTAESTLEFITRELSDPAGGFYSSLDADSEGQEGKFYLWSLEEIRTALPDEGLFELFSQTFPVAESGNFEEKNIFRQTENDQQIATGLALSLQEYQDRRSRAIQKLFAARAHRIRPVTDDKVLVFWNALALRAFAEAARYLNRLDYLEIARKNASFILQALHPQDRLLRSWRNGKAGQNAFLEDYAALIIALLSLYQTDMNISWYRHAVDLADEMLENYLDPRGGFFTTRKDQGDLVFRPKEIQDNSTPSGNALAVDALITLSAFSDDEKYRRIAEQSIQSHLEMILRYPAAFSYWLQTVDLAIGPIQQIALVWPSGADNLQGFIDQIWSVYRSRTIFAGTQMPPTGSIPTLIADRSPIENRTTAYICRNFVCHLPVTNMSDMKSLLSS